MHSSQRAAVRVKKLLQDVEVEILPKAGHKLSTKTLLELGALPE